MRATSHFSLDSDLEAFSHNPTDGSFGALPVQATPLRRGNARSESLTKGSLSDDSDSTLGSFRVRLDLGLRVSHHSQPRREATRPRSSKKERTIMQSHELEFFLTEIKNTKIKYKMPQQVENDQFVRTQNSTSRLTRERNGWTLLPRKIRASTAEETYINSVRPSSCVTPAGTSTSLTPE